MNKIYADVSQIEIGSQPDYQWVVLASEVEELSVTNILLDIVPGGDGMGEEVYARSIDDVTAAMAKQWDLIEELQEELHNARVAASDTHGLIEYYEESKKSLQQRLTASMERESSLHLRLAIISEFVQKLVDCSKDQERVATGYLSDILDVIKGDGV